MTTNPAADFKALVRAIGGGFHPDTRGDNYTSLPEGYTAGDVDRIVDAMFATGVDPYEATLDLIHEIDSTTEGTSMNYEVNALVHLNITRTFSMATSEAEAIEKMESEMMALYGDDIALVDVQSVDQV